MKKTGRVVLIILCILILLVVAFCVRTFNYEGFPRGSFSYSLDSPNKENRIHIRGNEGNATGGGYIRVEVESEKNYTIYFEKTLTPNTTSVKWVDDDNLLINEQVVNIYNKIQRK